MSPYTARNGARRSWDYPACPDCGSDVLVEARTDGESYYCWACEREFTEGAA